MILGIMIELQSADGDFNFTRGFVNTNDDTVLCILGKALYEGDNFENFTQIMEKNGRSAFLETDAEYSNVIEECSFYYINMDCAFNEIPKKCSDGCFVACNEAMG